MSRIHPTTAVARITRALGTAPWRTAHAHSGSQSYVYLAVREGRFSGSVQFPVHDINHILELSIPEDEAGARAGVEAARAALERYAEEHLAIGDGSRAWSLRFGRDRALVTAGGTYAVLEFRIDEAFAQFPTQVVISYDGVIHAYPDRNARGFVKTAIGWGPFRRNAGEGRTFTVDAPTQTFDVHEDSVRNDLTGTLRVLRRRTVKRARGLVRRLTPARK